MIYTFLLYWQNPATGSTPGRDTSSVSAGKRPSSWWKFWRCQKEWAWRDWCAIQWWWPNFPNQNWHAMLFVFPPTLPHPKYQRNSWKCSWDAEIQSYGQFWYNETYVSKNHWIMKNRTIKTTGFVGKMGLQAQDSKKFHQWHIEKKKGKRLIEKGSTVLHMRNG